MPRKILTDNIVKTKCPEYQALGDPNVFFNDVRIIPKSAGIKPTPLRPPPMPSRIQYLSASAGIPLPRLESAVSVKSNNAIAQPEVNDLRVVKIAEPLTVETPLSVEADQIVYALDLAENRQTEDLVNLAEEGEPGLEEKSEEHARKYDPRFVELDAEGRVIDSYEGPRVEMASAFIQRQREEALLTQEILRTKVDDEHIHERVDKKKRPKQKVAEKRAKAQEELEGIGEFAKAQVEGERMVELAEGRARPTRGEIAERIQAVSEGRVFNVPAMRQPPARRGAKIKGPVSERAGETMTMEQLKKEPPKGRLSLRGSFARELR